MAVSRRLRFEILRRDNHACRYCGACAPDVPLTVDHVVPVALGGGDDPSNLVTACKDCNAGKSSAHPDSTLVADVANDALRWSNAMRVAADLRSRHRERIGELCSAVRAEWESWTIGGQPVPMHPTWDVSIEQFYEAGFSDPLEYEHLIRVTMSKTKVRHEERWTYFCGCVWRAITDMQDKARQIVEWERQDAEEKARREAAALTIAEIGGRMIGAFTDWDFYEMLGWCDATCPHPDSQDPEAPASRWFDDFYNGFDAVRR